MNAETTITDTQTINSGTSIGSFFCLPLHLSKQGSKQIIESIDQYRQIVDQSTSANHRAVRGDVNTSKDLDNQEQISMYGDLLV